jgi:hypothetical protein
MQQRADAQQKLSKLYFDQAVAAMKTRKPDYKKIHGYYLSAIECITNATAKHLWTNADFLRVMQSYQTIITNIINADIVDADTIAVKFTKEAINFYQQESDHDKVDINYYLVACAAILQYAGDRSVLVMMLGMITRNADKPFIRATIEAADVVIDKIELMMTHIKLSCEQMRLLSACYAKMAYIYYAVDEAEQGMFHAFKAIHLLGMLPSAEKSNNTFYTIARIYRHLASSFKFDSVSRAFFTFAADYFSGNKDIHFDKFEKVVNDFALRDDAVHFRFDILLQFMRLAYVSSLEPGLPVSHIKNQLQLAEIIVRYKQLLAPLEQREKAHFHAIALEIAKVGNDAVHAQKASDGASVSRDGLFKRSIDFNLLNNGRPMTNLCYDAPFK